MKEHDLGKLYERNQNLPQIISQRKNLVSRIGTGEIKAGTSEDNTLRVGLLKRRVAKSAERLSAQLLDINHILAHEGKREAEEYIREVKSRRKKLDEMCKLEREDFVKTEHLKIHEQNFNEFKSRPMHEPWLKKALGDLQKEKTKDKSGRIGSRPRHFFLPSGESVAGKAGLLLSLAEKHSPESLLNMGDAALAIYGIDNATSRGRVRQLILYSKRVVLRGDMELIETGEGDSKGLYLKKPQPVSLEALPVEEPKKALPEITFIDPTKVPAVAPDITITVESVDGVLSWKPHELVSYSKLADEVKGLTELIQSFRTGETVIPRAQNFLGNLRYEEKLDLAKRTLQGMLATTIAKDIEKIGQQGLSQRLGIQINQLIYFLKGVEGRDIIVKALESLPTLQRIVLYRALSTNIKEDLDHPDIEECDEAQFAIYIMHATWPKLRRVGFDKIAEEPIQEIIKPQQAVVLEKLLQTAFERSSEGDMDVSQIVEIIKGTRHGDYLLYTIKTIAEIGGFLEPAFHFFQSNSSTRGYAIQIDRILNEDTLPAEED